MNQLISIIVPTYKTNNSLKRAVDSVLNQTYKNIEVIVVDDNNPESEYRKAAEEIMKIYKKNKNVYYVKHEVNKNGSAARNTGVKNAHGNIIGFLDDDDFYYQCKIDKQYKFMIQENLDLAVCYYKRGKDNITFDVKCDYSYDIFMMNNTPQTSSFLLKKECFESINGFDETYARHQDYEFLLRFEEKFKIGCIPEILYEMTNNGVNNIPNPNTMDKIKEKFLTQFNYIIKEKKYNLKQIRAKSFAYVSFLYIKKKDYSNFKKILKREINIYYIYYLIKRSIKGIYNAINKKR